MIGNEAMRDSGHTGQMMDVLLEMVLDSALAAALQDPRVEAAEIYLVDDHTGELSYVCHRGLSEACVREAEATPVRLGEGIIGSVASMGEPAFIPDLDRAAGFPREIPKQEGYCAVYSLPLKSDGRVRGVWNLFFRTERLPSRYLNWLAIPAELMGVVFEAQGGNATVRQYEVIEQKYRHLVEGINNGGLADGKEEWT